MCDIDKIYPLVGSDVIAFNRAGRKVIDADVKLVHHYHVVRDYVLTLKGGAKVCLSAKIVRAIIEHEGELMTSDSSSMPGVADYEDFLSKL